MKPKITISDSSFLQYTKSFSVGGTNSETEPAFFEWEMADPQEARFVTDAMLKHAKGKGQVALLLESFFLHPEDYITAMQKPFDFVLTHNAYFAKNKGWLYYAKGGSWIDHAAWGQREKNRKCSILLSPKNTMPGHKLANIIAKEFGHNIDVFGLHGTATKMEALADYQYSVVIEAERTEGFFSEKLIDCISVGTIPIYWGDPSISKIFNMDGILAFDDLDDFEQLGNFIYDIFPNQHKGINDNIRIAENYRIAEDGIWINHGSEVIHAD